MHVFNLFALTTQCGGVAGKGTDFANLFLRLRIDHARSRNLCLAILYVDLCSALYSVLRELVLPIGTSSEDLEAMTDDLEVLLIFADALEALLRQPALLEQHITDKHLLQQVTEAHTHNWFVVAGSAKVTHSRRGVGPGDPLADLMFNLSFHPVLRDIGHDLRQAGFGLHDQACSTPWVDVASTLREVTPDSGTEASFIDDLVVAAEFNYDQLPQFTVDFIFDNVRGHCAKRGLTLNTSPGKTQFSLLAIGVYGREVKKLFSVTGNHIIACGTRVPASPSCRWHSASRG